MRATANAHTSLQTDTHNTHISTNHAYVERQLETLNVGRQLRGQQHAEQAVVVPACGKNSAAVQSRKGLHTTSRSAIFFCKKIHSRLHAPLIPHTQSGLRSNLLRGRHLGIPAPETADAVEGAGRLDGANCRAEPNCAAWRYRDGARRVGSAAASARAVGLAGFAAACLGTLLDSMRFSLPAAFSGSDALSSDSNSASRFAFSSFFRALAGLAAAIAAETERPCASACALRADSSASCVCASASQRVDEQQHSAGSQREREREG